ncbi:MAG TPA: hypothetical protein VLF67_04155 [Candidatus Saccharimonas sp.]|nr:hypothetical protein [Candidatus Saccharimonas sp.]
MAGGHHRRRHTWSWLPATVGWLVGIATLYGWYALLIAAHSRILWAINIVGMLLIPTAVGSAAGWLTAKLLQRIRRRD